MQLNTSGRIYSFHENFKKRFGLTQYRDFYAPTIFFGLYTRRDFEALKNHMGPKIAWFAGTDALNMLKAFRNGKFDVRKYFTDDVIVIAESPYIEKDLDEMGIKYQSISLFIDDMDKWNPVPLGEDIYWYQAGSSKYGKAHLKKVREAHPGIKITMPNHGDIPNDEIHNVYKDAFVGYRIVEHDGMSQTVAEMGLMGRLSISNGNLPCCFGYKTIDNVISLTKAMIDGYDYVTVAYKTREFFKENEKEFLKLIKTVCK